MLLKLYDGLNMVEYNIQLNTLLKHSIKMIFVSRYTVVCHAAQEKWGARNIIQEEIAVWSQFKIKSGGISSISTGPRMSNKNSYSRLLTVTLALVVTFRLTYPNVSIKY